MTYQPTTLQKLEGQADEIEAIARQRGGLCVSMYLPVRKSAPESEQNPLRLRELLETAHQKLEAYGMSPENARDVLQPVASLVDSPEELLISGEALAFLIDKESARRIELPYSTAPGCRVSNQFAIKPLLPLLQWNPGYTAVCINRGEIRVFRGNRVAIEAVEVPDMPKKLEDITGIDDPEKSLQHHTAKTVSAEGAPGSAPVPQMHGHGLPSDMEDMQFDRFFRSVSKALHSYLSGREDSLILFGVEENVGLFQSMNEWKERTVLSKKEDPHQWDAPRIKEEALKLLKPLADAKMESYLDRLNEARNKGNGLFKLGQCALAAATGRIELAAVDEDREVDGICGLDTMKVDIFTEGDAPCTHDLYDFIASETIRHGGEVCVLDALVIPGEGGVAATVRF
ncbi:MAG: hypothetical protein ACLFS1_06740 [Opitutales bacterium]